MVVGEGGGWVRECEKMGVGEGKGGYKVQEKTPESAQGALVT